jgi:hypothetical protein
MRTGIKIAGIVMFIIFLAALFLTYSALGGWSGLNIRFFATAFFGLAIGVKFFIQLIRGSPQHNVKIWQGGKMGLVGNITGVLIAALALFLWYSHTISH